ncbi:MAG: efflux RND transporter periplasmic adaptor subunit [Bacteroidales bacterium]
MKVTLQFFAVSAAASILTLALGSCKEKAQQTPPPSYHAMILKATEGTTTMEFATTTQSAQVIEVRPRVEGYLDKIFLKEGAQVTKGELLFLINPDSFEEDLLAAEANVLIAEAKLNNAKLEIDKVTPLVEKNIVSNFQLKSAQSDLLAAEAVLLQAKAMKSQADINLSYTQIRASVDGVVSQINVREGSLIKMSDQMPLTTISADGDIFAYFSISEKIIHSKTSNNLNKFPEVELRLADNSIYPYKGTLELGSSIVDPSTGTLLIKAIFPNKNRTLTTGLSGSVLIPITLGNSILVPKSATYELLNKTMVVIVNADNTVVAKEIKIIGSDEDNYIVSGGVQPGDTIILEGVSKIRDGQKIVPIIEN